MAKYNILEMTNLINQAVNEVFATAEKNEIQEMLEAGYQGALELAGLQVSKVAA